MKIVPVNKLNFSKTLIQKSESFLNDKVTSDILFTIAVFLWFNIENSQI